MQRQTETFPPLLLFHGLLSSPQEFGLISHALRGRGITHRAPRIPGYTLACDPISPDWRHWRDAALEVVDGHVARHGPVVLGGLCMGGVLAAAVALEARHPVEGLVLMAPTFAYDGWGLLPVRHLRRLAYWTRLDRFFSVAEREPYGVKSAKIRKWVIRELEERSSSAVGPARLPLRALREGERMMAKMRTRLSDPDGPLRHCPLLVIHAREDEITSLESVRQLFDSLPFRDKELAVLENSYHMITIDNDRREVVTLLERFVRRLKAGAVASPAVATLSAASGRAASVACRPLTMPETP
ncbi:MAG: alpha/beta fold hydrolase [Burkholderiales bacterium]